MTIRHLKIFMTVAETGKMSLAAEQLFITQPTVSQAIRELEDHYGVRLFERLSKKLYITDEGKRLLIYARQAVEQFERVEQQMASMDKTEHLKMGTTMTVGDTLLSQLLKQLEERMPDLDIYTFVGNTEMVEERLLNTELMVGIVEGNIKSQDLVSIPMVEDFLVLACPIDHPLAKKDSISPEELEGQKFAMREHGSGTRALFDWYLNKKGIHIKTVMESGAVNSLIHAVTQNGCMAAISVRLLEEEVRKGNVRIFSTENGELDRNFKFVYHKDRYLTNGMENLKECLKNYKKPDFLKELPVGIIRN